MTHVKTLIAATLITICAAQARANDAINIACYDNGNQMYISFDPEQTILTFSFQIGDHFGSFLSAPKGWAQKHSYVTVQDNGTSMKLVGQILGGDPETVLFESNARVTVGKIDSSHWILKSVEVYHEDVEYPLSAFVGKPCYVQ
jgi:hypothetical protein